ncbi:MAG: hypothetical protein K8F60_15855 [Melioribacteraceae bacterium]|nr:hypothetical protein [Melioribacteraceae bacterium]
MGKVVLTVIVSVVLIFILFLFLGSLFTKKNIDDQLNKLYSSNYSGEKFTLDDTTDIPLIVSKYLDYTFADRTKIPKYAVVKQNALFRTSEKSEFSKLTAVQHYNLRSPGFVWVAELMASSIIPVKAIDTYLNGKGNVLIKLLSSITISDETGPEMDQSSLMRYFVEAPFVPYILLPSNIVKWSLINQSTAKVEIVLDNQKYEMEISFNQKGEIVKVFTKDRYRTTNAGYVKSGFTARFNDYKEFNGIKIPTYAEIEWNEKDKDFMYGKFTVESIEFVW